MPETSNPWDALVEPSARLPRSLETRKQGERKRSWVRPSVLPEIEPRDGWVHKWVRTDYRGISDKKNYGSALREGWEPIDLADYPELQSYSEGRETGHVEVGGLIACRIPAEIAAERNDSYRTQAVKQEQDAEAHYMRDEGELIKKVANNSRRVVFGQNVR